MKNNKSKGINKKKRKYIPQKNVTFLKFSTEPITIILSLCSGSKHVRRSLIMKPVELKDLSTAAETAGM